VKAPDISLEGIAHQLELEAKVVKCATKEFMGHHFRRKWGNSFMVDGDLDQALAAEPGLAARRHRAFPVLSGRIGAVSCAAEHGV